MSRAKSTARELLDFVEVYAKLKLGDDAAPFVAALGTLAHLGLDVMFSAILTERYEVDEVRFVDKLPK